MKKAPFEKGAFKINLYFKTIKLKHQEQSDKDLYQYVFSY